MKILYKLIINVQTMVLSIKVHSQFIDYVLR